MLAAAIVDWGALGKVVAYSFAGGLVLTIVFTTGVLLVDGSGGRPASAARRAAGIAAFGVFVGLVAFGLYVMFTSK